MIWKNDVKYLILRISSDINGWNLKILYRDLKSLKNDWKKKWNGMGWDYRIRKVEKIKKLNGIEWVKWGGQTSG